MEFETIITDRATRIAELFSATAGQDEHRACGVSRRPCKDCRRTAPLPCVDPLTCGIDEICRPCAAVWRVRIWRFNHLRHVRRFHCAVERFPALAALHPDPDTAAALWWDLRRAMRRDAVRQVRSVIAQELPEAVDFLAGRPRK